MDTLSYLVEHGKLLFEKGHSDQDLLIEQLIYLENKNYNDDGPDALEAAVALAKRLGASLKVKNAPATGPRTVKKPLSYY